MIAGMDRQYVQARPWSAVRRMLARAFFEGRPITTGHRWLNPVVLAQFRLLSRLPQLRAVTKPVFIVGTGRSGTTILGMILSVHRDAGYLNEPKALWHVVHPEDDVIGHYSRGPARYCLTAEDATPEVQRTAHRLFGAVLLAMLARRSVDKNPELVFRVPYVRAIFPDAKFIFLVRNGWNACYSIATWSEKHGVSVGAKRHDWWGVDNRKWRLLVGQVVAHDPLFAGALDVITGAPSQTDMAVVEWVVSMREGLRQAEQAPEAFHVLPYERLTGDPAQALTELMRFCELDHDAEVIRYARRVLTAPPKHPRLDMHPALREAFSRTQAALGYE